ncbi:MAG: hypothetical protein IKK58_06940 [Clostridia bacterium]|nr:hypothetical protein [Clostridia bacterium]
MKKGLIITAFICILLMLFTSCSGGIGDTLLNDQGKQVVSLMAEMANSDEYRHIYYYINSYDEVIAKLREGDYSRIASVYELSVPTTVLLDAYIDDNALSPALNEHVYARAYSMFAPRLIQAGGLDAMAVSSLFSAQKSFACLAPAGNKIYLYTFQSGYPIAVTFIAGDDSYRATGYFIINDEFKTDSEQAISDSCKASGINGVTATRL